MVSIYLPEEIPSALSMAMLSMESLTLHLETLRDQIHAGYDNTELQTCE